MGTYDIISRRYKDIATRRRERNSLYLIANEKIGNYFEKTTVKKISSIRLTSNNLLRIN